MCCAFHSGSNMHVGEAQREHVLDGLLAEIMVDAERPLLGEGGGDRVVDLAADSEVGARAAFRAPMRTVGQARPAAASPSMVGLNSDGAVDRKMATP